MGQTLCASVAGDRGRRAASRNRRVGGISSSAVTGLRLAVRIVACGIFATELHAQFDSLSRFSAGRFTVVADARDDALARALLASAAERDTFPGLPRPQQAVLIAIAPDARHFREWAGGGAPEWGAAVAFPARKLVVLQGRAANSSAGDPVRVLRHELAHLALFEALGDKPPRWFHEGYASVAAGEWGRDDVLATSVALAMRRGRTLAQVDSGFDAGVVSAEASYALAWRAVEEMQSLDSRRGLTLLFQYWRESPRLDAAVRRAYGITLDGFEKRWQDRTRLRYGALAIAADLTAATLLLLGLLLPLWVARRKRDRRKLATMRAADVLTEQRARESAIEELLRTVPPGPPPSPPSPPDRDPSES